MERDCPEPGSSALKQEIEINGRLGLFDDLVGVRFAVIARSSRRWASSVVESRGFGGLERRASEFLAWPGQRRDGPLWPVVRATSRDARRCSCGQDFYVQGGARNAEELNALLDAWRASVAVADYTPSASKSVDTLGRTARVFFQLQSQFGRASEPALLRSKRPLKGAELQENRSKREEHSCKATNSIRKVFQLRICRAGDTGQSNGRSSTIYKISA